MAPNLHWPDTIFTHDAATNHLFTCDAFGMHYCTKEAFDPAEDKVLGHYAFYYEVIFRRASPWGTKSTSSVSNAT
jgi:flavorubredoxin